MRENMTYKLSVTPRYDKQGILSLFEKHGVMEEELAFEQIGRNTTVSFYTPDKARAESVLSGLLGSGIHAKLLDIPDKEWQTGWKEKFRPFRITQGITIVPYAYKDKKSLPSGERILIDTDMAFGSGLHATTKLMAAIIRSMKGRFSSFLDIGTGTGILSLVARLSGAKRISAIDIDAEAVNTARRNFRLNGLKARVKRSGAASFGIPEKFDLVAANLLSADLVLLKEKLLSRLKPGGYLAVSGISAENWNSFKKAFNDSRLSLIRRSVKSGWCAGLYTFSSTKHCVSEKRGKKNVSKEFRAIKGIQKKVIFQ